MSRPPADRTNAWIERAPVLLGILAVAVVLAVVGSAVHGFVTEALAALEALR